jgi:ABC-2 type transport system permease protein
MNKIYIVASREFLTRVKKKTFLLTTIGLPILIFGLYALIIFFTVKNTNELKIAVADNANIFNGALNDTSNKKKELKYQLVNNKSIEELNKALDNEEFDAYVYVPKNYVFNNSNDSVQIISKKSIGLISQSDIKDKIGDLLDEQKLLKGLNVSKNVLDSFQKPVKVEFNTLKNITAAAKDGIVPKENETIKSGISYGVGMFSGFLIYITLFIYGTMVMRGVMEEKTNRIAEVIVSSVKPFQLMMGKIIGIGSVGLVQFLIWIVLVFGLQMLLPLIFPDMLSSMQSQPIQPGMVAATSAVEKANASGMIGEILASVNIPLIVGCFLFYFLGGYFMYASLFAAVGSTVNEDPQDAQSLTLPITMPIIFAFVIMMQAINAPNSAISVFGSLFPLTSPIVMMARVAHGVPDGVPVYQLILSMVFLVVGFIGTTWLAGKIYRTGILMYGKKVTLKELAKWAFKRN